MTTPQRPAARTCKLSDGRCRQCLGGQRDHVIHGDHTDLTPLLWLQDFDARLALVHGLHMGTQVVHSVEATTALVTQVRLLSWGGRQGSRLPLRGGEDLSGLQLPQSPVSSSSKCSGAVTGTAQEPPVATAPSGNQENGVLIETEPPRPPAARTGTQGWALEGPPFPPAHPQEQGPDEAGSASSPVWMMMCLDRSPTFTKALLHTLHL